MTDDKKLDDIILWKGSKRELSEDMDVNVQVVSTKIIRLLPSLQFSESKGFITSAITTSVYSINVAEVHFMQMLLEKGFSGVIRYSLLSETGGRLLSAGGGVLTSYGCEGHPIIITPRSYRT